jgi:hypothetical protein
MYEKNEKLYKHMISHMEKVRPSFQYEPLIFIPKLETLDEKEEGGNIMGARPSTTRIEKEHQQILKEEGS